MQITAETEEPDPLSEVEGVLQRLREIGLAIGYRGVVSPAQARTPSEFAERVRAFAAAGPSEQLRDESGPRLAADLVAFLADGAAGNLTQIAAAPGFGAGPQRAWREGSAGPFWRFSALVADVWEHVCDPEMLARDAVVMTWLTRSTQQRIYDFGAGAGAFALAAEADGAAVVAVDNNSVKRAFVRFRRAYRGLRRSPRAGKGCADLFDVILALDVLDHLASPAEAVAALARRLRPGGVLLLQADFLDDGWHAGGEPLRRAVGEALRRWFRYGPAERDPSEQLMVFVRRELPERAHDVSSDPGHVACLLDPAAAITPFPQQPGTWLIATRHFYSQPLLVTEAGRQLALMCRQGPSVKLILDTLARRGIEAPSVIGALRELLDAGLCYLEANPSTVSGLLSSARCA